MLQNTVRGGNEMGGGIEKTAAPTSGQQQGAGRGSTGCPALTETVECFGPAATTQKFSKIF